MAEEDISLQTATDTKEISSTGKEVEKVRQCDQNWKMVLSIQCDLNWRMFLSIQCDQMF